MNATLQLSYEPRAALLKKLKSFMFSSRMRANTIRLIDTDWPQATEIRALLVDYVGLQIMSPRNVPALMDSVERACIAYSRTLGTKPDHIRLQAFLDTLLDDLSFHLAGFIALSPNEPDWRPSYGRPLSTWLKDRGNAKLTRTPRAPDQKDIVAVRKALLVYLGTAIPPQIYEDAA